MTRLIGLAWLLLLLWPGPTIAALLTGEFSVALDSLTPEDIDRAMTRNIKGYKIGLALSGGGARGLAQIGILDELERAGIDVDLVAGTSMGGIIGGLYAAGLTPAELEAATEEIDWRGLFSDRPSRESQLFTQRAETEGELLSLRFEGRQPRIPTALSTGQKLMNILETLTQVPAFFSRGDFENLDRPLAIVATDIVAGEKVVFTSGSLASAMRATSGVPLAFTPLETQDRLLLDGGLLDPIPTTEARELGADFVIAVNTTSPLLAKEEISDPIDIANQTTTIMQAPLRREALAAADFVVEPDLKGAKATDFNDVAGLIEQGRRAVRPMIDDLQQALREFEITREMVTLDTVIVETALLAEPQVLRRFNALVGAPYRPEGISSAVYDEFRSGRYRRLAYQIKSEGDQTILEIDGELLPIISHISFAGNSAFSDSVLHSSIAPDRHQALTLTELYQIEESLLETYRKAGFDLARIRRASLVPENQEVLLELNEGRVTGISVEGNQQTRWWVAASYFTLKPGDLYSKFKAAEGVRRIYASGLFENVRLQLSERGGGVWLTIQVKEKNYAYLKLGARYHEEFHPESFLKIGYANLGGSGNDLSLFSRFSERRKLYQVQLRADRIFRTLVTYNLRAYYQNDKVGLFTENVLTGLRTDKRWGVKLSIGQQLARFGLFDVTARYEHIRFSISDEAVHTDRRVASLSFNLRYDTKDRFTFPTKGRASHLSLEFASDVLGAEEVFRKFEGYIENYLMLAPLLNLRLRGSLGISDNGLPIYDRFYLGGSRNFIGYRIDQLSGDKYLLGTSELRLGPWNSLYLSLRYDMGEVFDRFEQLRFQHFRHTVGAQLALSTPLGPIAVAYGRAEGKFDNVYLNLGFDF
ncbi:MAG: patatin-like phospholipase family protein [bacterium]